MEIYVIFEDFFIFCRVFDVCDVSLFNKLVGIYFELVVYERVVDILIELFKKD